MLVQTRLQLPRDGASPELFRGLYDGVLPPLLAGLPSGENAKRMGARMPPDSLAVLFSARQVYRLKCTA